MLDLNGAKLEGESFAPGGYARTVDGDPTTGDLLRLAAATEVALSAAESLGPNVADEATLVELRELHDRAHEALGRLEHRVDVR
jgi:hypothetical protein